MSAVLNDINKSIISTKNANEVSQIERLTNLLDFNGATVQQVEVYGEVITVRFISIGPDLAEIILAEFNNENRPFSEINIKALTKEMVGGKWYFNGESMTFNNEGNMSDGQHRLKAIIRSGMTFPFFVVCGINRNAFPTINNGRTRTGSDVLGIGGVPSTTHSSSICKFIYGFKNEKYSANRNSNRTLSNTEVLDYYNSLPKVHESVNFGINYAKKANGLLTSTLVGGFHYLLSEVDPAKAEDFMIKVCTGVDLSSDSPITLLRNKLIRSSSNNKAEATYRLTNEMLIKNLLVCWDKYLANVKLKVLKVPDDYVIKL